VLSCKNGPSGTGQFGLSMFARRRDTHHGPELTVTAQLLVMPLTVSVTVSVC
jgi:hypothetical protein